MPWGAYVSIASPLVLPSTCFLKKNFPSLVLIPISPNARLEVVGFDPAVFERFNCIVAIFMVVLFLLYIEIA